MNPSLTVGQLVVERPSRARIFERFGIDYCCGGTLPLAEACQKKALDPRQVLAALEEEAAAPSAAPDLSGASLTDLTAHIEATHHAYLKRELPRLDYLTGRVASRHGDRRPELHTVHEVLVGFKAELEAHMMKEERVLFPMCRALDRAGAAPDFHCGSVRSPVAMMVAEHENAGADLRRMRELTGGYVPPEGACNTYRAMLAGLTELEADMHQHVHIENNILFPRAIAAESRRAGCAV